MISRLSGVRFSGRPRDAARSAVGPLPLHTPPTRLSSPATQHCSISRGCVGRPGRVTMPAGQHVQSPQAPRLHKFLILRHPRARGRYRRGCVGPLSGERPPRVCRRHTRRRCVSDSTIHTPQGALSMKRYTPLSSIGTNPKRSYSRKAGLNFSTWMRTGLRAAAASARRSRRMAVPMPALR